MLLYLFTAIHAKALYHKETLCQRNEVQRFLSSLILKPPEVGHLVNCFHMAKPTNQDASKKGVAKPVQTDGAKTGSQSKKVITFSTIDNFGYQSWRDFSDSRLISVTHRPQLLLCFSTSQCYPQVQGLKRRVKN